MYSILSGTATDVSMLIDYLPTFLFPNDDQKFEGWGVLGVSLGGHAVWCCLNQGICSSDEVNIDERIKWGCAIIGCPSYIELMEHRLLQSKKVLRNTPSSATNYNISRRVVGQVRLQQLVQPPHLPTSFIKVLERNDPGTQLLLTGNLPSPLKEKSILVLSGKADRVVPWRASAEFISLLQQQCHKLDVRVYDDVGHEYTPEMKEYFCHWVSQFL